MRPKYINSLKRLMTIKERVKDSKERDTSPIIHLTERVVLAEEESSLRGAMERATGEMLMMRLRRRSTFLLIC